MKATTIVIAILLLTTVNCFSQLKVNTDGTVKIGSATGWPQGGDLQIVQNNKTTEGRVFATSPNIARWWTINSIYAYGFGIDAVGVGQIYGNIYDPNVQIISFNKYSTVGINWPSLTGGIYPYKLLVGGDIYCNHLWETSLDESEKVVSRPIESALDKIMQITGKTITSDKNQKSFESSPITERLHFGFSSKEVGVVFPNLIKVGDNPELPVGINYTGLIPVLVEALKEQQRKIINLEDEINSLKLLNGLSTQHDNQKVGILNQNVPNPFNYETLISYSIESDFSTAIISLYNLQGTQLKTYKIEKGSTQLVIKGSEYQAGMYLYSLIIDGKIVDTKQMVLTN